MRLRRAWPLALLPLSMTAGYCVGCGYYWFGWSLMTLSWILGIGWYLCHVLPGERAYDIRGD
jgi:hypothetical protein